MSTVIKKRRRVTIRDVLDEHELELLGITESIDGSPVNSARKRSEFLEDVGMCEDPVYLEIQDRYRGKLRDKETRDRYYSEMSSFRKNFFKKKLHDHAKENGIHLTNAN